MEDDGKRVHHCAVWVGGDGGLVNDCGQCVRGSGLIGRDSEACDQGLDVWVGDPALSVGDTLEVEYCSYFEGVWGP